MSNDQVAFPCPFGLSTSISQGAFTPFPTPTYSSTPQTPDSLTTPTAQPTVPVTSFNSPYGPPPSFGQPILIPPGTFPNFSSPPTLAPAVIGINITFITLSFIAVSLRIWGRRSAGQKLWSDDWFILVAWVMAFLVAFSASWSTRAGAGRHAWDIPPNWVTDDKYPQAVWLLTIFFVIACTLTKISLLIFYHRFSASIAFRQSIYATALFVVGTGFSVCMALFFICLPVEANWIYSMRYDPAVKCLNMLALFTSGTVLNAVADLVVWILPIPIIVRSQMSSTRKKHVYVVLLLGGLVVIASFVRVHLVVAAEKYTVDYGWRGAQTMIASAIEVNIGIICACLPAIKHLLTRYFPHYFAPTTESFQKPPSNAAWTQMWRKFIPSISLRGSKYSFEENDGLPKYDERTSNNIIINPYIKQEFYSETISDTASTRKLYGQFAKETGTPGYLGSNNGTTGGNGGYGVGGEGGIWTGGSTWGTNRSGHRGHTKSISRETNISKSGTLKKTRPRDNQRAATRGSDAYITSMYTPKVDDYRPRTPPYEPAHVDLDKWPGGKL